MTEISNLELRNVFLINPVRIAYKIYEVLILYLPSGLLLEIKNFYANFIIEKLHYLLFIALS